MKFPDYVVLVVIILVPIAACLWLSYVEREVPYVPMTDDEDIQQALDVAEACRDFDKWQEEMWGKSA